MFLTVSTNLESDSYSEALFRWPFKVAVTMLRVLEVFGVFKVFATFPWEVVRACEPIAFSMFPKTYKITFHKEEKKKAIVI